MYLLFIITQTRFIIEQGNETNQRPIYNSIFISFLTSLTTSSLIKMKFFVATLFIGLALGAPQGSQKDRYETVPYTVVATHHVGDQSVSCFMNS